MIPVVVIRIMAAELFVLGGFFLFVVFMMIYHCYLKKQHRKELEDVILREDNAADELKDEIPTIPLTEEALNMTDVNFSLRL